jgi:hypothetical protein
MSAQARYPQLASIREYSNSIALNQLLNSFACFTDSRDRSAVAFSAIKLEHLQPAFPASAFTEGEMMSRSDSHVFATDVLKVAADLAAAGRAFVLAVVTEAQGSTSARPGAKAIIDSEGTVVTDWVGGGCAESAVAHAVIECLKTQTPQIIEIDIATKCSAGACRAAVA